LGRIPSLKNFFFLVLREKNKNKLNSKEGRTWARYSCT